MMSINDSFILQTLIFTLIQKEITDSRRQLSLLTVFEKIKFRTEVGQMLDLNTVNQEDRSLNYQSDFGWVFTIDIFHSSITMRSSPTRQRITPSSCPSTWVLCWVNATSRFWSHPSWLICVFSWEGFFRFETTIWMCLRILAFWRR